LTQPHTEPSLTTALDLLRQGKPEHALPQLTRAVQQQPHAAELHFHLGNALNMLQQPNKALACYQKALSLNPDLPGLHNNLGNTWLDLKQPEKALVCFEAVLARFPQDANALNNKATALRDLRRIELALASYERALAIAPNHLEALNNHGNLLIELHRPEQALQSFQKASQLSPHFAPSYRNGARAMLAIHRPAEALRLADVSLQLNNQDAFTWMYQGDALRQLQRIEESVESYGQALRIVPDLDFISGLRLYLKMQIADWQTWPEDIAQLKTALQAKQRYTVPMPTLGLLDDPQLQKVAAEIYMQANAPESLQDELASPLLHQVTATKNQKIKIGYFSAHFHDHPSGRLMTQVIEQHDTSRFELYAFSFGIDAKDGTRQRLFAAFDEFIDVRFQSDTQVAQLSRSKGIDIAIDLTGYYDQSRPDIFSRRCAPIQVSYLITPGTLGLPAMDYLLADRVVVPPESFTHFTEQVVHLPHCYFTFDSTQPISDQAVTRSDMGLPEDAFVFCCFNSVYKILPPTFDIWMRLLKSVPGSVMWLLESHPSALRNLKAQAMQRGIDPERLVFSKVVPIDQHLARQPLADLFLDTWPCNAHTTACDALYAGLPVLTCPGQSFASRVAASLLTALNLPELITDSPQAYEHKALELAQQPAQLQGFRERLKASRSVNPLFQGEAKARELEAAYQGMMQRYRDGLAPTHFSVTV
jgi:predicted O-linked N-acetylglucosamine transferase (SPINDLY family)